MTTLSDFTNDIAADAERTAELLARLADAYDLLAELQDFKPTVTYGRAPDPQDSVDDLMPVNEFEAFQEDAAKLLKRIDGALL